MRDEVAHTSSSIGAILTRGVETLAVACLTTGNEFPDRQNVFVVFSAHVKKATTSSTSININISSSDDPTRTGTPIPIPIVTPAVVFFSGPVEASVFITECLDESGFAENHPGELYDDNDAGLETYSAYIVMANEIESNSTPRSMTLGGYDQDLPRNEGLAATFDRSLHAYSIRGSLVPTVNGGDLDDSPHRHNLSGSYFLNTNSPTHYFEYLVLNIATFFTRRARTVRRVITGPISPVPKRRPE